MIWLALVLRFLFTHCGEWIMTLLSYICCIGAVRGDQLLTIELQDILIRGGILVACIVYASVWEHRRLVFCLSCNSVFTIWLLRNLLHYYALQVLLLDQLICRHLFLQTHLTELCLLNWLDCCCREVIIMGYLTIFVNFRTQDDLFVLVWYLVIRKLFIAGVVFNSAYIKREWVIFLVLPELSLIITYLYCCIIVGELYILFKARYFYIVSWCCYLCASWLNQAARALSACCLYAANIMLALIAETRLVANFIAKHIVNLLRDRLRRIIYALAVPCLFTPEGQHLLEVVFELLSDAVCLISHVCEATSTAASWFTSHFQVKCLCPSIWQTWGISTWTDSSTWLCEA